MKIKLNFISNSSSASFFILWRVNINHRNPDDDKYEIIRDALENIFLENNEFISQVAERTTLLISDIAQTKFYTVMYNDIDDFGDVATRLVSYLQKTGRLINSKVIE